MREVCCVLRAEARFIEGYAANCAGRCGRPIPKADGVREETTLCGHWHAAESKMAGTLSDSEIKSRQLTFSPSITAETETPARQSVSKLGRFMTTWDGLTLRRN